MMDDLPEPDLILSSEGSQLSVNVILTVMVNDKVVGEWKGKIRLFDVLPDDCWKTKPVVHQGADQCHSPESLQLQSSPKRN